MNREIIKTINMMQMNISSIWFSWFFQFFPSRPLRLFSWSGIFVVAMLQWTTVNSSLWKYRRSWEDIAERTELLVVAASLCLMLSSWEKCWLLESHLINWKWLLCPLRHAGCGSASYFSQLEVGVQNHRIWCCCISCLLWRVQVYFVSVHWGSFSLSFNLELPLSA